jgi:acetyltransferase
MQVDLAKEMNIPLARLSAATMSALCEALPEELVPSNPLDCAADLTDDFSKVFDWGLGILAEAPEVSMLGLEADLRDDYVYEAGVLAHARKLAERTEKPVFFFTSFGQANNRRLGDELADCGVPTLNGAENTLKAIRDFQAWANARREQSEPPPNVPPAAALLPRLSEVESLSILASYGVPTAESQVCSTPEAVEEAGKKMGFPLVLKTAEAGIDHKSDVGGVVLNIGTTDQLRSAYTALSNRLGPRVTVQQQASRGVELAFGCVVDLDFGPLVMVSPGGTLVELFQERQFRRAPFGPREAEEMIRRLRVSRLIEGVRGEAPRCMKAAAAALSAFSVACSSLKNHVNEIDVNPVVVTEASAIAVDALIVPSAARLAEVQS